MEIEVQIMQADFQVRALSLHMRSGETVADLLTLLIASEAISDEKCYGLSIYGVRVKTSSVLSDGDRVELSLSLPKDPLLRRRQRALKRKK
jgi:putative ubiquitin-RnfH superfamily antitoxin RatB of RatAB toxin-antitoxin module